MIKICFFLVNIYPLFSNDNQGFGGAEMEMFNITKKLSKDDDFQIKILTVTDKIKKSVFFGKILVVPIPPYNPIKKRKGYWLRYLLRIFKKLWDIDADIYFSKLPCLEVIIVWLVTRLKRKKIIFRLAHDWETNFQDLKNKIFSGNFWLTQLFLFCFRKTDLVIAQTKNQKELLKQNFNIDSEVIYNAHYISKNPENNKSTILWVARIHPIKKPEIFLELVKKFPQEKFIMIASINPGYENLFFEIKTKSEEIKNLNFIKGIPHKEISSYYKKAKILILTSKAEGLPNVLIEAIKEKTPVVSLFIDPDNILTENKIGFYANGDFNKLVVYVNLLLNDKDLWREYSENAYNFAKENFDIQKIIKKYTICLRHIVYSFGL